MLEDKEYYVSSESELIHLNQKKVEYKFKKTISKRQVDELIAKVDKMLSSNDLLECVCVTNSIIILHTFSSI